MYDYSIKHSKNRYIFGVFKKYTDSIHTLSDAAEEAAAERHAPSAIVLQAVFA